MRSTFFLLIILASSFSAFAQIKTAGSLQGTIIDTAQQGIEGATLTILTQEDSSITAYGLSKKEGRFVIEKIPFGQYFLRITLQSFEGKYISFSVTKEKPEQEMGNIVLSPNSITLDEVIVQSPPIVINGDTTEFKADQFKTIPNATVEDLLKKLPGTEVEKDGTIKSQGQTVTRVLVDGKKFFGNDPKMATRNLPAEMIDKVQIIDAKSEQSEFSGFDDGERVQTINIITKKDRRKGVFGKGSLAAGTNNRLATAVSANRFNGNQQLSFILQGNNINSQNFSVQDFLGSMGGANPGGGKGGNVYAPNTNGISTTLAGGVNYNDVWDKKTQANGSYFYNQVDFENNRDRFRETFVANDSSLFNTNQFTADNNSGNHRFNLEIDHRFDSVNSILFRPSFSEQQTDNNSETHSYTTKGKLVELNQVLSKVVTQNEGYNLNNSLLFRHRFNKRGRSFSINLSQGSNTNDRRSTNITYTSRTNRPVDTLNQISSTNRRGENYGANLSWTEPLGTRAQAELIYNYNHNENRSDQQTFRLNKESGKYDIEVANLTNLFENTNVSQRLGVNYRMQLNPQWNYIVGMAVQHADLTSNNLTKARFLDQSFNNLFPTFVLHYRKTRSANMRFSYRGATQQPNITQLQDVVDNSNVLHIRSGNPELKQEFTNNFNFVYNTFNTVTFRNFSVNLNGSTVANKIGTAITINTTQDSILVDGYKLGPGAQFSKPENLDGAFALGGNINYGIRLKSPKSNINVSGRFNYNRDINQINQEKALTKTYVIGATIRYTLNLKEKLDLNFSSNSTYHIVKYERENQPNNNYFTQRFSLEPTYTTKNGWIISNDFDYNINRGQSTGFNQAVPLWNAGIARLFLKKRQAELRFTVFDMLNQNQSFSRNVEQNYIEDVRSEVLNRYFLVSFTYFLRKFKGPQGAMRNNNKPVNHLKNENRNFKQKN